MEINFGPMHAVKFILGGGGGNTAPHIRNLGIGWSEWSDLLPSPFSMGEIFLVFIDWKGCLYTQMVRMV